MSVSISRSREMANAYRVRTWMGRGRRGAGLLAGVVLAVGCGDGATESAPVDRLDLTDEAALLWRDPARPNGVRQAVFAWNEVITQFFHRPVFVPGQPPPRDARGYAMASVAIHDALNAVERRYAPHAYTGTVSSAVNGEAAIAAAVHGVLVSLGDELTNKNPLAFAKAKYDSIIATIPNSPQKTAGITLGQAVAAAVVAKRANDGSVGDALTQITVQGTPGEYRPPATPTALTGNTAVRHWATVKPFVMQTVTQFRSGAPYGAASLAAAVRTPEYLADYNETRQYGGNNANTLRTPEQNTLAIYWIESSAQGWNRLTRNLLERRPQTAWGSARLLAQVHLAIADAYVSVFDSKYHWNFWRPITAIRLGNLDPATPGDPLWNASTVPANGPTPAVPEWPSAHAMAAAAAAEVIKAQMPGTTEFTMESSTVPGQPRTVPSVDAAVRENSLSRIYAGFHWRAATLEGERVGKLLGRYVAENSLLPQAGR